MKINRNIIALLAVGVGGRKECGRVIGDKATHAENQ